MRLAHAQLVVIWSGAVVIAGGLSLIIAQFWVEVSVISDGSRFGSRSASVDAAGVSASVETTYVGLVVLVVGAVLEIVGLIATRPWRPAHQPALPPAPSQG